MAFMTDGMPGGGALLAQRGGPELRPVDVFKGDTTDRIGDGAFADPRETRLIGLFNNVRRLNRALGDPLGLDPAVERRPRGRVALDPELAEAQRIADAILAGERDP